MNSYLEMAAYAAAGAGAAGLLGWPVIMLLRRRSLALSLFTVAFVTALSLSASTVAVARAMLLERHDYAVVTIVLAMGCLVSLAVAALLSRQVAVGSRALARAARTVGSDDGFSAPDGPLNSELSALSAELAATSARLAQSRQRERALEASRRELIAWMSHDLRTPLAGLRAMAEALEDGVAEDPPRYHSRIRIEVDRLTGMVDDLFELSRIQAGALTLTLSRVSVYDLVGDAIAGAHPLARERGVHLVGDPVAPAPVEVDSREITRVLGNLLVNAIRSTPVDGTVAVAARREDQEVVVSVTDGCGGIDEQDLARVFETGWRGGSARTPRSVAASAPAGAVQHHGDTGAGLGLAIVRGIVEAHAGRATVRNVHGGCCFEIALPAAVPTPAPATPSASARARATDGLSVAPASMVRMRIVVLAGGIGGARFLRGLKQAVGPGADITVIGNTGDDIHLFGLKVCPDLDTVMYTLGGGIHEEQGWGRSEESYAVKAELKAYGVGPEWFGLGDKDFATHIVRTQMLGAGYPLSAVTEALCARWQPGVRLIPMSDDRVETHVMVEQDGVRQAVHFQEFWVKLHASVPALAIVPVGAETAKPAPGVLEAIAQADVIILPPSNPVVSVGTILSVPGIRAAVAGAAAPVVGLSPIIGGAPVRGMADKVLAAVGVETSAAAVALHYGSDLINGWLVDESDAAAVAEVEAAGIRCRAVPLWMTDAGTTAEMARAALALAEEVRPV